MRWTKTMIPLVVLLQCMSPLAMVEGHNSVVIILLVFSLVTRPCSRTSDRVGPSFLYHHFISLRPRHVSSTSDWQ